MNDRNGADAAPRRVPEPVGRDPAPRGCCGEGCRARARSGGPDVAEDAGDDDLTGPRSWSGTPSTPTPEDVKGASGVLIATPANFGYMSGAVKDFFERVYHPCLESDRGMPYAMIVKGDTDVDGAARSIERIATGMRWREVLPPLLVVGRDRNRTLEDAPTSSVRPSPPVSTRGSTDGRIDSRSGRRQGTEGHRGVRRRRHVHEPRQGSLPGTGFTKGDVIRYYVAIAPFMLPHLKGRALTLRRYPNGVDDKSFFEKRCPSHAPDWVKTSSPGSRRARTTRSGPATRGHPHAGLAREHGRDRAAPVARTCQGRRQADRRWCSTSIPVHRQR